AAYHRDMHAFRLEADIDLSGENLANFPLGTVAGTGFRGWFDGGGHSISNYTKTSAGGDEVAFFSGIQGQLRSLALLDVNLNGGTFGNIGVLSRWLDGLVTDVHATGTLTSGERGSGLLTNLRWGVLANSYSTVTVNGGTGAAGLVAFI